METVTLTPGTKIVGNAGLTGTIVRHYEGNMYEVRYPGGLSCHDVTNCPIVSEVRYGPKLLTDATGNQYPQGQACSHVKAAFSSWCHPCGGEVEA